MIQRLKTSNKTSENLEKIQNKLHLSSKAAILRICLSLSLNDAEELDLSKKFDNDKGFDISLNTLFGEYETMFKALIRFKYGKEMNESTFVKMTQAHIERGMIKLYGEFATNNSIESFIESLMENNI